MDYIIGVDRGYHLELCISCYQKIVGDDAVVMRTDSEGDPGPYHVSCFESTFKLTVPRVMSHVHTAAAE